MSDFLEEPSEDFQEQQQGEQQRPLESFSQESSVEWDEGESAADELAKYVAPDGWLDKDSTTAAATPSIAPVAATENDPNGILITSSTSETPQLSNKSHSHNPITTSTQKALLHDDTTTSDFLGAQKSRKRRRREMHLQRKQQPLASHTSPVPKQNNVIMDNGLADLDALLQQVQTPQQQQQSSASKQRLAGFSASQQQQQPASLLATSTMTRPDVSSQKGSSSMPAKSQPLPSSTRFSQKMQSQNTRSPLASQPRIQQQQHRPHPPPSSNNNKPRSHIQPNSSTNRLAPNPSTTHAQSQQRTQSTSHNRIQSNPLPQSRVLQPTAVSKLSGTTQRNLPPTVPLVSTQQPRGPTIRGPAVPQSHGSTLAQHPYPTQRTHTRLPVPSGGTHSVVQPSRGVPNPTIRPIGVPPGLPTTTSRNSSIPQNHTIRSNHVQPAAVAHCRVPPNNPFTTRGPPRMPSNPALIRQPPPTVKPALEKPALKKDEFDDIDFSMEDFAAMDTMVLHATQSHNDHENLGVNSSSKTQPETLHKPRPQPAGTSSTTVEPSRRHSTGAVTGNTTIVSGSFQPTTASVPRSLGSAPKVESKPTDDDPFGDFSDFDFEAMDKLIVEHKHQKASQPDSSFPIPPVQAAVCNPRVQQPSPAPARTFLSFSRYKVMDVLLDEPSFTKTLAVATWTNDMLKENPRVIHKTDAQGRMRRPVREAWPVAGAVHLRGEWYHTPLTRGDVIHICSLSGLFRTDMLPLMMHSNPPAGSDRDDDLVLIVHPDLLLTPTTISETVSCSRRAILKNRLGSSGLTAKAPLFGTMRHQLFEETMKQRDFSPPVIKETICSIVRKNAEGLVACGVTSKEAEQEMYNFVPQLQQFAAEYTDIDKNNRRKRNVSQGATLVDQTCKPSVQFLAKAVESIEEPAISPELGLKGNIDMIVNAVTANRGMSPKMSLFGVELKTGHNQATQGAHMAQLVLYILMLKTRYGSKMSEAGQVGQSGMLLYLNNEGVRAVNILPVISELKTLLAQRNQVAIEQTWASRPRGVNLSYEPDIQDEVKTSICSQDAPPAALPNLLYGNHACNRCYANRECMMYAETSLHQDTNVRHDLLQDKVEIRKQFTGHLVKEDFEYFAKWDRLIDMEADAGQSLAAEAWLKPSQTIEKESGKCISALVYDKNSSELDVVFDESSFATISFCRSPGATLNTPLSHLGLEPGCNAIVSVDKTTTAVASKVSGRPLPRMHIVRGFLHSTTDSHVTIKASRDDLIRLERVVNKSPERDSLTFRIDRDNSATGIGTLRQNLVTLFTGDAVKSDSGKSVWWPTRMPALRDIIVRGRPPRFEAEKGDTLFSPPSLTPSISDSPPGCDLMDLFVEFAEMNPDQKAAIQKVMAAQDCSVIQGLPGTGKSEVITFVARLLAAHGKRVLISAYTHSAVDNVMMKLITKGLSSSDAGSSTALVRVGRTSSCHPSVRPLLVSSVALELEQNRESTEPSIPSAENLKKVMKSARIVGVTALSIPRSPLLIGEHFDVVIVDEAGQISQPAVIGALTAADSFVLVGDHMQLPPLVSSELAAEGGFGESLLKRLADSHPDSIAQLTFQYRMHEEICKLSNDLVYGGTLKCANDTVRSQQLTLPNFENKAPQSEWLRKAVDPSIPVVFLDTDGVHSTSTPADKVIVPEVALERTSARGEGGSIVNDTEAKLVRVVVDTLTSAGLSPSSIGVVCPFRAQLRLLDGCDILSRLKSDGLEISTIDRYQGRDKPAIILSFVRSNHKHKVGRLLEDVRRLNVAVTRAKCKLIMIGSYSTLFNGSDALKPALNGVRMKGRVVALPRDLELQKIHETSISS